jgi:hypothetical protein
MTIDEWLKKLAERHEPLAQSVEMLAIENRNLSKAVRELSKFTNKIATATARLLSIAESHEHRITRLEGQL